MRTLKVLVVIASVVAAAACATSRSAPPPHFARLEVATPIEGVDVVAALQENEIWTITVRNETDDAMLVLWDESSLVGPDGNSWGRLISTRERSDAARPHPPSPVAPHASATEAVLPSRYTELPWGPKSLAGVRLVLALQRADERLTWQGIVREGE